MYNNELKQLNKQFIINQKFAKELSLKPINIDINYSYNQILKLKSLVKIITLNIKKNIFLVEKIIKLIIK